MDRDALRLELLKLAVPRTLTAEAAVEMARALEAYVLVDDNNAKQAGHATLGLPPKKK